MRKSSVVLACILVGCAASLIGCAPAGNPLTGTAAAEGTPVAGFWLGLWQGLIVWVTFVISLFDPNVGVYEVHNSGWPYNLGFVIGAACLHGSGGAGICRRSRRS